ncbi:hypothetical protein ASPZODRAFT_15570 [Penicilliopsis zonata CBS 506.65]|uniref:Uncharacterized protein n=1 Tax=Penicilliopsis zonata CBS 506.65 TaxID=1073090 RepID=A0A1L9SIH5_9EURO|nr:hypothetical protein ASPZODRAFT_15570 [Penicilliopsis zonata CBS 506.65]OJJ46883.1 hypothetical protein ASPZODRAFT_15570 [Penicilliopsis zonata CBS 506.65]
MSSTKKTTNAVSGTNNNLNAGNLRHLPGENHQNGVERFAQSGAADEPYFARARMQDRSAHASRLSSQLRDVDAMLKK